MAQSRVPRRIFTIEIAVLLERGLFLEDDQVLCKRDGAHIAAQVGQARRAGTTKIDPGCVEPFAPVVITPSIGSCRFPSRTS